MPPPATVAQLIALMKRRQGVTAAFAEGEDERYLVALGAEGVTRIGAYACEILLRADQTSRATAVHEWLHRRLTFLNGGYADSGQDAVIERFLAHHRKLFKLDD